MAQNQKVITVRWLTNRALLRQLPNFYENVWEMRTGTNPVATALGVREKKKIMANFVSMLLAAAIFAIELARFIAPEQSDAGMCFLVQTILLVAIMLITFMHQDPFDISSLKWTEHHVKEFCDDLSAFCTWSGRDPEEKEEVLKQAAYAVMLGTALTVLRHEMTTADVSNRYDTLRRLGLVPVGGYKEYFDEAQKLLEREKSAPTI